jgi:hypothetical protein
MKNALLTIALLGISLFTGNAYANSAACEKSANEQKLAGAARAAFFKKCASTAPASACEKSAADKKLAGAAKASHIRKCEAERSAKK